MGIREGSNYYNKGLVHSQYLHQAVRKNRRRSSPCTHKNSTKDSHNWVWVPAVPSWEKEFCYKIGQLTWEKFLEAKKYSKYNNKIMEWNDSGAEEAFHRAKNEFFAEINGLSSKPDGDRFSCMHNNPDLYIDEINWDDEDEVNPELLHELERAKLHDEEERLKNYNFSIENIKPTGWDVDIRELSTAGRVLTGLIVGY